MPGNQPPARDLDRAGQVTAALWLVSVSVIFGLLSGAVSVAAGLHDNSLSVLATGLGILADVTGSATLIWRFAAERRQPGQSPAAETRAALVVAAALAVVSAVIIAESAAALAARSRPGASDLVLIAASVSLAVLTPLACAKRRLGAQMASRALQGDGTLSGIGAATSLLALTALALYHVLGWWWPDRMAALIVAAVAAAGARRTIPARPRRGPGSLWPAEPSRRGDSGPVAGHAARLPSCSQGTRKTTNPCTSVRPAGWATAFQSGAVSDPAIAAPARTGPAAASPPSATDRNKNSNSSRASLAGGVHALVGDLAGVPPDG